MTPGNIDGDQRAHIVRQGAQPHRGSARVHLLRCLKGPAPGPFAVRSALRPVDLRAAGGKADAVGEIGNVAVRRLAVAGCRLHQTEERILEVPVEIGVLHDEPGGVRSVVPNQGAGRIAVLPEHGFQAVHIGDVPFVVEFEEKIDPTLIE